MISRLLLIAAAIYFLVGITLGMYMGITEDYRLRHVHVHINVLGWISLSIIALAYQVIPRLNNGWIPKLHFWMHNLGLLLFMVGIAYMQIAGDRFVAPVVIGSSMLSCAIVLWSARLIVELLRRG